MHVSEEKFKQLVPKKELYQAEASFSTPGGKLKYLGQICAKMT